MTSKPTTYAEIAAAVDQELLKRGTPLQERIYLRSKMIEQMERDAAETAKAEAARQADAVAERTRIAGVVKVGVDRGRPRQAARLALLTPVGPDAAGGILQSFPLDRVADAGALGMPAPGAVGSFGSPAAQAERARIASILGDKIAADRFMAAVGLATTTDLVVADLLTALAMMSPEAATPTFPSLEQRSRECGSFGPSFEDHAPGRSGSERSRAMWAEAIARANREAGATSPDPGPAGSGGLQLDAESRDRLAASRGER